MLPQKYPFALLEREADDSASPEQAGVPVLLTASARLSRGRPLAQGLALEILAQAALVELMRPDETESEGDEGPAAGRPPRQPAIAGFDDVHYAEAWARRPPQPGEMLRARTELLGRFGPMLKVHGRLLRDGEEILTATLLLVSGQGLA